jgi:aspartate carbamoyltransferase catalytic subunit
MKITDHDSIEEIVPYLDVIYVTRIQRERFPDSASYFNVASSYRITPELLSPAKKHAIVLHPLPRVDEIDPRVDGLSHAKYFEQSRNGVPVRMAMLQQVMQ